MNTIPETCMIFTQVFNTVRIEMAIAIVVGILIGRAIS